MLGGTGKTGHRVVNRLRDRGLPVRVGSRSGQPRFDWADESTWAPVLQGARAVYIPYPDLVLFDRATEATRAFAELAIENGVDRLVLLTGRGEDEAQRAEREVQATGADVTVVRCAWFMQIFSEDYLLDPVRAGEVVLPAHDGQLEPFVDADDIADVAVAALTEPGHAGQVYELTSPRAGELPRSRRRDRQGQRPGHHLRAGVGAGLRRRRRRARRPHRVRRLPDLPVPRGRRCPRLRHRRRAAGAGP